MPSWLKRKPPKKESLNAYFKKGAKRKQTSSGMQRPQNHE